MNQSFCVFVVDDDALLRMVIVDQLQDLGYQIHEFANGADCLAALDKQPNLILLDIEMPGKSGLEVCQELRDQGLDEVQVVFVTAHDDLETLMAAFRVGGNDFVVKNTGKEILLSKVQLALQSEVTKQRLKAQLSDAQKTAFTALFSLGEAGQVMQFFRACFDCGNLSQLAALLGETFSQFSLNGLICLTGEFETVYYSTVATECTPLEQSILSYVAKLGRVHQVGDRLVLNYPSVTLLITDLEEHDSEAVGRLRDNLALIAEAASMRIAVINQNQYQAALQNEAAKRQLSDAQNTAFTAMFSLGETGLVMQFVRNCFACSTEMQLVTLLGETLVQFSLDGLIRLTGEFETVHYSTTNQPCTQEEQAIISYASKLGRVHQAAERLVLNYPAVVVVVAGLENHDADAVGRLRDHWALIAEAASMCLTLINHEKRQQKDVTERIDSAGLIAERLAEIEALIYANNSQLEGFTEQYQSSVELFAVTSHLTDDQENALQHLVDSMLVRFRAYFESHIQLLKRLTQLLDQQKRLLGQ